MRGGVGEGREDGRRQETTQSGEVKRSGGQILNQPLETTTPFGTQLMIPTAHEKVQNALSSLCFVKLSTFFQLSSPHVIRLCWNQNNHHNNSVFRLCNHNSRADTRFS